MVSNTKQSNGFPPFLHALQKFDVGQLMGIAEFYGCMSRALTDYIDLMNELFHGRVQNVANGYVFKGKPIVIQFGRNPAAAKAN